MATRAADLVRLQPGQLTALTGRGKSTLLLVGVLAFALAVGATTAANTLFAIGLVGAAAVIVVVAWNANALPILLVFTMFIESLSLGPGLRVGRVAGVMALAVVAYTLLVRGRAGLRINPLLVLTGAYGFWMLLSVYWASDSHLVYKNYISFILALAYMLTFAVLVRTRAQIASIFATLAVGSLIFGFVSFVTYASSSGTSRAAGLQGDPNYFAVYQVIALPAVLALSAYERRPARRFLYFVVVGVIVLSVVSSLSRTGLIALSAAMLATIVLPWRIFFQRAGQKGNYVFALVLATGAAVVLGSASFVSRAQSILNPNSTVLGGAKGSGRLDLWAAALHGWHEHPVLGLGLGGFETNALDLLQTTPGVNTTASYVSADRVVHNAYIENLAELGPIGLVLFVSIIFVTAFYLVSSSRRGRLAGDRSIERFSLAMLVSLLGYSLSAIFLSNQLGKALWILVGMALALDVMSRRTAAAAPALVEARAGPAYDQAVAAPPDEEQERREARQMQAVASAEQRLDRRRAALAEREREFAARIRAFEQLERDRGEIAERIARGTAEVARRRRTLAAEELESRQRIEVAEAGIAEAEGRLELLEARAREVTTASAEHERISVEFVARERELVIRAEALAGRESELVELSRQFEVRGEALAARELELTELHTELNRGLAGRDAEIGELKGELEAMGHALAGRGTEISDLRREFEAMAQALAERDSVLNELRQEIGATTSPPEPVPEPPPPAPEPAPEPELAPPPPPPPAPGPPPP